MTAGIAQMWSDCEKPLFYRDLPGFYEFNQMIFKNFHLSRVGFSGFVVYVKV